MVGETVSVKRWNPGGHRHMVGGDSECREVGEDSECREVGGESECREVEPWGAQAYGVGRQ